MGTALIILLIAVGLLVVAVLVFFGIYNGLVRARIGSETAWSDIDPWENAKSASPQRKQSRVE